MIASLLQLSRSDLKALKVTDPYSLHRVVYDLFDDVRNVLEKNTNVTSGILYADKGGDGNGRKILILSNRAPHSPKHGQLETKLIPESFLQHEHYAFEVMVNPTKRDKKTGNLIAIRDREAITQWFVDKAPKAWGFKIKPEHLQIQNLGVQQFKKNDATLITQGKATFIGQLIVTDREHFIQSFKLGIGRGRAFGFGLLQISPLSSFSTTN